jgi:CRP/FNR family transcriptional regulator, cyclic AMP receptor protein
MKDKIKTAGWQAFKMLENVVFLKKTALFSMVRTAELRALAAIAEEADFEAGEEIIKVNEPVEAMFIIKEGRVKNTRKSSSGINIDISETGHGDCLGEVAMFNEEALSPVGAYAFTRCSLLRIRRDDLLEVIVEYPDIAVELLKNFAGRLRKAAVRIENISAVKINEALIGNR